MFDGIRMNQAVALALTAGMLAAFNPCGFALLPGYLALFIGQPPSKGGVLRRAAAVGASVTTGFVAVFGTVGVGVSALSLTLGPWLSVATLIAGAALLVLGVVLLLGHHVTVRTPRARARVDGSIRGMVAYGIVYATVSLSCTLPVYLAAVVSVFSTAARASILSGTAAVLAYAVGMGLVMTTLAVIVGLAGHASLARARAWTRLVGRASGVVVTAAAAYVLWYAWVELRTYSGSTVAPGPVLWVAEASSAVSRVIVEVGATRLLAVLLVGLVAVGAVSLSRASHTKAQPSAACRRRIRGR